MQCILNIHIISTRHKTQMKLVMSEGQEELEKKMQEDPETYECVTKLNQIMGKLGQS